MRNCHNSKTKTWMKSLLLLALFGGNAQAEVISFNNLGSIAIPGSRTQGNANPFPSSISVLGITNVTQVTVNLFGLSHAKPDDIDFLLVGPTGEDVLFMSDTGGFNSIFNVNLTFDDSASAGLPNDGLITTGTYKPTNFGRGETFPGQPYGTTLSVFNNLDPNGLWQLFIVDDGENGVGSLAGGWQLNFTATPVPLPPAVWLLGSALVGLGLIRRREA